MWTRDGRKKGLVSLFQSDPSKGGNWQYRAVDSHMPSVKWRPSLPCVLTVLWRLIST